MLPRIYHFVSLLHMHVHQQTHRHSIHYIETTIPNLDDNYVYKTKSMKCFTRNRNGIEIDTEMFI